MRFWIDCFFNCGLFIHAFVSFKSLVDEGGNLPVANRLISWILQLKFWHRIFDWYLGRGNHSVFSLEQNILGRFDRSNDPTDVVPLTLSRHPNKRIISSFQNHLWMEYIWIHHGSLNDLNGLHPIYRWIFHKTIPWESYESLLLRVQLWPKKPWCL